MSSRGAFQSRLDLGAPRRSQEVDANFSFLLPLSFCFIPWQAFPHVVAKLGTQQLQASVLPAQGPPPQPLSDSIRCVWMGSDGLSTPHPAEPHALSIGRRNSPGLLGNRNMPLPHMGVLLWSGCTGEAGPPLPDSVGSQSLSSSLLPPPQVTED